jgi:hypothetical protein
MTQPLRAPSAAATWNDVCPVFDEELDSLPDEARRLLIACYLQEKTHAEAAAELGLPRSSAGRHVARARALLVERLACRGLTLSASQLTSMLREALKGTGVPVVLLVRTVESALTFKGRANKLISQNVARLVKDGLARLDEVSPEGPQSLCD